ncbi:YebG family protein [Litorivivens sp.]|uniref:YebG family protein n=1 Tax=Litorivivens sp. TaxID=2020868 RepID=UPI0035621078
MAVIAKWMCDRDNTMFDNKKDADAYDKMLELAEQLTELLLHHVPSADEKEAEEFGILLARNKELLIQASKGKIEVLANISGEDSNVTTLAANG